MSDLEQSIADKLNRFLGRNKTVVTTAEIGEIVEEMGPVDAEVDGDVGGAADTGAAARDPGSRARVDGTGGPEEPGQRKLFKLTGEDEKMLAGVCAGLSAYFGLDVAIVRIVFLALIFATSGLAILAYVALAIVIPAARTPEQVARAYGVPFDARGVIDRARFRFDEVRQSRRFRSQQPYGNRSARSAGFDGIGSLLGLLVVLFAILIGLYLSSRVFFWLGHPFYLGSPHYGGLPWWMTVVMVIVGVWLIGWIFGDGGGDGGGDGRSRLGSLLVKTIQVVLILLMVYLAYRALPFLHEPVNALMHLAQRPFW
jgi:phage shock protein PspC (stress-responsive transcriptional regulator)